MENKELEIKVTEKLIEGSIKIGNLWPLARLFLKLEKLTEQELPESKWFHLKELMIKSGKTDLLEDLYYCKWKEKVETEEYKREMFRATKIALQKKDICNYINGCRRTKKKVNKEKISLILEESNYKYFMRSPFNSINVSDVIEFYDKYHMNKKIPNGLLLKIEKQETKKGHYNHRGNYYFWICRKLNKEPSSIILKMYYKNCMQDGNLEEAKWAKGMLGEKISKRELLKWANYHLKKYYSTDEAEKFFLEYYSS